MRDVLYLAGRYLAHHRAKTAVLVGSITLILFLPAALRVVVGGAASVLADRAERTPLVMGARGSAVDLVLSALYFTEPSVEAIPHGEVEALRGEGLGAVLPLHLGFTAGGSRIVGTTPEYFGFRGLELAEGRRFAVLGEAVLGARAAAALGVGAGSHVVSTPAGAFDVAGSFPLRMQVVGVLAPAGTPDDDAVFVDLRTAWVIEGIGHGHDDVAALESGEPGDGLVEAVEEGHVVAGPALLPYTEITPENLASFHFHGDESDFPLHAAIVVPQDERARTLLLGRYLEGDRPVQLVAPGAVVDDLVETLFSVRDAVLVVSIGLGLATAATAALVFALSIRVRRAEIESMRRMGVTRRRLHAILATEILAVLLMAGLLAGLLTLAASRFGGALVGWLTG